MKKVCLYDYKSIDNFHGYAIDTFDYSKYFTKTSHGPWYELLSAGWNGFLDWKKLYFAEGLDKLYRSKNQNYMRFIRDFLDNFADFDLVVLSTFCPIHPEIIYHELKKPVKILGFIDDPFSTYVRGLPYLWAFDGAFYISPSYSNSELFCNKLEQWGCSNHAWWPLVPKPLPEFNPDPGFFRNRENDIVYIGQAYGSKIERLRVLKKKYGNRFGVYGYWPFKGYHGFVRGLLGNNIFPYRVKSVTQDQRQKIYCSTKIGFNMHLSDQPRETGNMRMYETVAHGLMELCDKAGHDAHELILTPDKEAVFYNGIQDAIDKIDYYLAHEDERIAIAEAGYLKFKSCYAWDKNLKRFLDWAINVPRKCDSNI